MDELLKELKGLDLPEGDYVVFGSGPMGVRGIRPAGDIDLLITDKLWENLLKQSHKPEITEYEFDDADGIHKQVHLERLKIGNVEMYREWLYIKATPIEVISDADVFDGVRFGKLKYVLESKKNFNRPKDKVDVKLIEEYLSKE